MIFPLHGCYLVSFGGCFQQDGETGLACHDEPPHRRSNRAIACAINSGEPLRYQYVPTTYVSEVSRQKRQQAPRIFPGLIPTCQYFDSKAVTEVIQPRPFACTFCPQTSFPR